MTLCSANRGRCCKLLPSFKDPTKNWTQYISHFFPVVDVPSMNCDVDLGHTCMLEQYLDDDFDWDVEKNGTEVRGTGPHSDNTSRKGTLCVLFDFCIYIPASYISKVRKPIRTTEKKLMEIDSHSLSHSCSLVNHTTHALGKPPERKHH